MGAAAHIYSAPFATIIPGVPGEQYQDITINGADFNWEGFTWSDDTKKVVIALEHDNNRIFDPEFVPIQNLKVDRGNGFFFKKPKKIVNGQKIRVKIRSSESTNIDSFTLSLVGDPIVNVPVSPVKK